MGCALFAGLAISKSFAEMMGGTMWAESEVGKGSTFHFTVRARSSFSDPPDYLRGNSALLSGKSVLIVDDNASTGAMLTEMTRFWGMNVRYTDSPQTAAQIVASASTAPHALNRL